MKEIPLSNGGVALVDDEDYERVVAMGNWQRLTNRKGIYVGRCIKQGNKRQRYGLLGLHRFILNPATREQVDHIDGDGLNNTRANLRIATAQQNMWNRRKHKVGHSIYKGVSRFTSAIARPWSASVCLNGSMKALGRFATEEAAAHAYDDAARKHFGEFARVNFPRDGEQSAIAARSTLSA